MCKNLFALKKQLIQSWFLLFVIRIWGYFSEPGGALEADN